MISNEVRKQYKTTIGIECHVQLKTKSKLFSASGNDAREAPPNTLVSHIDFGMPGALPVLNKEAVHLAIRAGFAFNVNPQHYSYFERKHYFYPDLPLGYQITQLDGPIVKGGTVTIHDDAAGQQTIRINRVQIESDAGKSTHPAGKDYSLVDLNRAGTPLLEIVSEPDIHSAASARQYTKELYLLMRYADVSDCNLYYGNMRFDVNVSVSKTDDYGTRTETKNLNSFRAVEKAAEYEITRQIEVLERGDSVIQETRGWDDSKQRTFSQRTKEDAHDYRYFPDPDLPPVVLDEDYIEQVRAEMPVMPAEWRERLVTLGLESAPTETLLSAQAELDIDFLSLIETALADKEQAKTYANWTLNVEVPLRREQETAPAITQEQRSVLYPAVYMLSNNGKLSSTNAKALLSALLTADTQPTDVQKYAEEKGYIQDSNEDAIAAVVSEVIAANPQAAADIQNGETKAIGFLVGRVMKQSHGKANPALAQQLIKQQLAIK